MAGLGHGPLGSDRGQTGQARSGHLRSNRRRAGAGGDRRRWAVPPFRPAAVPGSDRSPETPFGHGIHRGSDSGRHHRADGPMSAGDVIRIGMQVAAALHYLHGRRLVHLDLKPANLILRDGRAIIIDLGFAETTGYQRPSSRPRGSPPYMAPEQCRCQPVAPAMDLFALGAVLYEVATGDPAFETAPDPGEDEYPQLRSQARPAHQSGVVKPLSAVIDALLEPRLAAASGHCRAKPCNCSKPPLLPGTSLAGRRSSPRRASWPHRAPGPLPQPARRRAPDGSDEGRSGRGRAPTDVPTGRGAHSAGRARWRPSRPLGADLDV